MAEQGRFQSDKELGDALRELGRQLRYPATPDLTTAVRQGIQSQPVPLRSSIWRPGRLVAIAAMLLVLIVAAVLAIPTARTTVADWFNVPGVTLFVDEQPVYGGELQLGAPVTLDGAREGVGFTLLVPDSPLLGEPDEIYLDAIPVGGAVSLVYHASDEIPQTEETGVGILLSQFQGSLNPNMYGKGIPGDAELEYLEINGHDAYWLSGEPHPFYYLDAGGDPSEQTPRMAGNTLLWQDGDLTLRLESALDLDAVLEIAASMREVQ